MDRTKSLYKSEKNLYIVEKIIINISLIMVGFLSTKIKIIDKNLNEDKKKLYNKLIAINGNSHTIEFSKTF